MFGNKMYVLTAVVPVYGISRNYENLRKMFTDIPTNIQVLVVHDKTDGEDATLLREIASFPNFEIMEVLGGSAGRTRNHALSLINSEWTMFWDADDCPFPQTILNVINEMRQKEIDLIVGSFTYADESDPDELTKGRKLTKSHAGGSLMSEFGIWRCIFRSERIKNLNFSGLKIGEDLSFILRALPSSSKQVFNSPCRVYEYKRNSKGSITNSPLDSGDFEETLWEISKIEVLGDYKQEFKNQILLSLKLSQFKRFPSASKLTNLVKFCFHHPETLHHKLQGLRKR